MSKPTVSAAGGAMPAECRQQMKDAVAGLDANMRQSTRRTLLQMAELLDVDAPEGVAIAVRTSAVRHGACQRQGRA